MTPPARELVPGDVIRLRMGDIVPADARLLAGDEVQVDQSALTGESLPVTDQSGDAVFSGSIIRQGEIGALVYATGSDTYFGKTAELVQDASTVSHFQQAVLKIGKFLILLALALVSVIVVVSIIRGDPILTTLQFALVLTVAAIPVAMPTVLSVTMAVGARLLAKKKAIVSKLVAIEELAGVDVLCSDKTGTLTQNKLTLGAPFTVGGVSAEQVIVAGALASRADDNDTIDLAVLGGLSDDSVLDPYEVGHFQPFDPVHKRTESAVTAADGTPFKVTKGAPQVIMELSANAGEVHAAVDQAVEGFAKRGYRSLGVARAEGNGPWRFLGVLPLFDPPRVDAEATIATAEALGVRVKMVTGDQVAIAQETAKTLGMGSDILDASSLGDVKRTESGAASDAIEAADGFAQVFPEHKFHIVDVLQKRGHMVGMTGDGVNDAPALKEADCGIAVSDATDAARAAADIVLMTPGLSVIIDAIKESRRIVQRMNSYAIYRIAETLARPLVRHPDDPDLQLLPGDGHHDRGPRSAQRRCHSVHRLRQRPLQAPARGLEHAPGHRHGHRPRRAGPYRRLRPVLPRQGRIPPRSRSSPDPDVPDAFCGRVVDHLLDPHAWAVLVRTTPSADPFGGRAQRRSHRLHARPVRDLHAVPQLALGALRVGLCTGVVPPERPGKAAGLPGSRSGQQRNCCTHRHHLNRTGIAHPHTEASGARVEGGSPRRRLRGALPSK